MKIINEEMALRFVRDYLDKTKSNYGDLISIDVTTPKEMHFNKPGWSLTFKINWPNLPKGAVMDPDIMFVEITEDGEVYVLPIF